MTVQILGGNLKPVSTPQKLISMILGKNELEMELQFQI